MEMLRGFHLRMEATIFEHGGTLEQYIGDAMFATFGTPDTGPQDATNALACARAMLANLEQWNAERTARGERPIRIGVGVHYGPVVIGDIGSERSMAFTVIGDTVNIASRLEGLTRDLDTDLVVSEALIERVREEADGGSPAILEGFDDAGEQQVKGRNDKIPTFVLRRPEAA